MGSPGLSWALLGSPGLSWAPLGSLDSPGLAWAPLGSPVAPRPPWAPGLSWCLLGILGSPGLPWTSGLAWGRWALPKRIEGPHPKLLFLRSEIKIFPLGSAAALEIATWGWPGAAKAAKMCQNVRSRLPRHRSGSGNGCSRLPRTYRGVQICRARFSGRRRGVRSGCPRPAS